MLEKHELLSLEERGWTAFVGEVRRVPEHVRADPGVVPGWSVIDLVFHVGVWAGVAADKLDLLRKGEPAEDDDDWESMNQAWAARSKSMPYEQAMAMALQDRQRAREALQALDAVTSEAEGWFKEETIDHYAEHADEIGRYADTLAVPEK
jgi:Mycothiol maleylpyruvate isomerase N-terminal domain